MDDIKKVVAGGCSFTAGAELADHSPIWPFSGCIRFKGESTWAHWVQRKLYTNAVVDNVAMPGSDFGSCVRRVVFHIDNLLKSYQPQEIVVVVMWTSFLRREYLRILPKDKIPFFEDDEDKFWCSLPSDAEGYLNWKSETVKQRKDLINDEHLKRTVLDFYRKRADNTNIIYYPLQQIEYLMSYLNLQGVKFYFTSAFDDFNRYVNYERESNIFIDSMVKRLNLDNIIHTEDNLGFNDWSVKRGYKCGPRSHPLEAAHKHWADRFCTFIENQRSLS